MRAYLSLQHFAPEAQGEGSQTRQRLEQNGLNFSRVGDAGRTSGRSFRAPNIHSVIPDVTRLATFSLPLARQSRNFPIGSELGAPWRIFEVLKAKPARSFRQSGLSEKVGMAARKQSPFARAV